jgi:hypothetical protein
MKIFLSYASEDKAIAEPIIFSLRGRGHEVFLDRDNLPPSGSYDQQTESAVNDAETTSVPTPLNRALHPNALKLDAGLLKHTTGSERIGAGLRNMRWVKVKKYLYVKPG